MCILVLNCFFVSLNQKIYSIEWAQLKQPISKEQLAVPTLCLEDWQMTVSNFPREFIFIKYSVSDSDSDY